MIACLARHCAPLPAKRIDEQTGVGEQIIQAIELAYGSLERPDWSFVAKRMKEGLYDDLIEQLAGVGSIVETTDQNDDCSRCLYMASGIQTLTLKLSLVGDFACVHDKDGHVLPELSLLDSALGEKLSGLLKMRGLELVNEDMLRTEIVLGGEKHSLYEVLFSSDGLMS